MTWGEIVNLCRLTLPAEAPAPVKPNCNVAPTQQLPIVRPHGKVREGVIAGWGLVPFWMMDLKHGAFSTINARCETEYLDCWKGADLSEPR